MENIKEYVIIVICALVVIHIGGAFVSNTAYKKVYSFVCGIIIILFLSKIILLFCNIDINLPDVNTYSESNSDIKYKFENRISDEVKNFILNKYKTNCIVVVYTDFNHIVISVKGNFNKSIANQIKEDISEKFCTQNDEVIITYES